MSKATKKTPPRESAAAEGAGTPVVDAATPDSAAAQLEELRVPFATTARLPSDLYAVLTGELVLRSAGKACGECGGHTAVRVENFAVGREGTRWMIGDKWDALNAEHHVWLGQQKRSAGPKTKTRRTRGSA